jgi:uncharacterized heparinase superfamily protein
VELEPLGVSRRPDVAVRGLGLPGRLRSLLPVAGWGRKPEPRVRYGQPAIPGLAALGRQPEVELAPWRARAEAVCRGERSYLGRTLVFDGRVDWQARDRSDAWRVELHALDDLFALGVAAATAPGSDARRPYADAAVALVRDWLAHGSRARGPAWRLPALARRIPNLITMQGFFAAELRADARLRRQLLQSLWGQVEALAALVPAAPQDRWLVAAGKALFMAGRFFDGMEARGWLDTGAGLLWGQLREQVNEDGGHRERDPGVQAAVLADYLDVFAMLLAANDDVPIWARKRVKGMTDFLARLLHPDGDVPLFHGAVLDAVPRPGDVLATAAVLLHEPGCAPPGSLGVRPLVAVGESGLRVHAGLPRREPGAEARALRRTGFYVLPGACGDTMILDGGAAGLHGGPFGYELSVGGARMVVESGAAVDEPGDLARYLEAARAHNVVLVDGVEPRGGMRAPQVSDVQWVVRDGLVYFGATHDGFAAAAAESGIRQRRHVFCLPGRFWIVCDQLLGGGGSEPREIESLVHFHPDVALRAVCRGRVAIAAERSDDARLLLVPSGADEIRIQSGVDERPVQGWYADRWGAVRPAPCVALVADGPLPRALGYALVPRADSPIDLALTHDAFHLHVTLRTGTTEVTLSVVQGDVEMQVRAV